MAMTKVVAGATAAIGDLNQLIDLLEGTAGFTESFLLRCGTGTDFLIRLADAAGARKWIVQDSTGATVGSIDSSGNLTVNGTVTGSGGFTFPLSAAPVQTADGSAVWDTVNKQLTVGNAVSTIRFRPQYSGTSFASAASLNVGTSGSFFHITGATGPITSITTRPAGDVVTFTFDSTPAITHNAVSLALVGAANYTAAANDTLVFVSEGSGNWRQVVSTSPIGTAATLASATSTTSTVAVDLVTLAVSIAATKFIRIVFNFRKQALTANATAIGLKVNTTVVVEAATTASLARNSGVQQAEDGICIIDIAPRSNANYSVGMIAMYMSAVTANFTQAVAPVFWNGSGNAAIPQGAITSLVLRGINNTASNALEVFAASVLVY